LGRGHTPPPRKHGAKQRKAADRLGRAAAQIRAMGALGRLAVGGQLTRASHGRQQVSLGFTGLLVASAAIETAPAAVIAATAIAALTIAAAAAAAAAAAILARTRFIHGQRSPVHFLTVQGRDGGLGLLGAIHLDKAEAFGASGVAILDYLRGLDCAV